MLADPRALQVCVCYHCHGSGLDRSDQMPRLPGRSPTKPDAAVLPAFARATRSSACSLRAVRLCRSQRPRAPESRVRESFATTGGCPVAQGYYFSVPVDSEATEKI